MSKALQTNCPNCGGELTSDGFCTYCNTKVRYANILEVDLGDYLMEPVEIEIKIKRGNELQIIPFKGHLVSYTAGYDPVFCEYGNSGKMFSRNEIKLDLNFSGTVCSKE
jgi:hypothetical protein